MVDLVLKNCGKQDRVDLTDVQSVRFTEANHAFVEGEVKINGVLFKYDVHLYRTLSGWVIKPEFPIYFSDKISHVAKQKAEILIPKLITKALESIKDLHYFRCAAETEKAQSLIESCEKEIAEKKNELADLENKWHQLNKNLISAKNGTPKEEY